MNRRIEFHFSRFRRRGDPRSLGRVFDLTAGELATIARQLVRDPETAEDVVQATFLTAIEKAHVFDERQRVMPWLIGILARHAARARAASVRAPDPDRIDRPPVSDPADDAENAELGAIIDDRIDGLPEGYASAVRPYLVEGKRPKEIARALGITANAASVRVNRGLELLRRRLPRTAAPAVAVAMPDLALVRENVIACLSSRSAAAGAAAVNASAATAAGAVTMKKSILLVAGGALLGSGATRAVDALTGDRASARSGESIAQLTDVERDPAQGSDARVLAPSAAPPISRTRAPDRQEAEEPVPQTANEWLARLLACGSLDEARRVLEDIAALDPDEGLEIMHAVWGRIPEYDVRKLALDVFCSLGHDRTHCVLQLGATDESAKVQTDALQRLSSVALLDLTLDFGAFTSWYRRCEGLDYDEVLLLSAREFGTRVAVAADDELIAVLGPFDARSLAFADAAGVDVRAAIAQAGVVTRLEQMIASDDAEAHDVALEAAQLLGVEPALQSVLEGWVEARDPIHMEKAVDLLSAFDLDDAFLRAHVLPIVEHREDHDVVLVHHAASLLGREGNEFAVEALLELLLHPGEGVARFFTPAMHLGAIGDPRAIPTMIAVIRADDTYSSIYGVGYFGLRPLTGVDYDESHDGAFWVDWWSTNRERMPASIRGMSIPYVTLDD
ncbi:MAG: RNA polymerase sigma factor [Planctomycetota bacterium]